MFQCVWLRILIRRVYMPLSTNDGYQKRKHRHCWCLSYRCNIFTGHSRIFAAINPLKNNL